jgi:structural maintenance of chromosome 2
VVKKERELLKMHNQVLKDQEKIHETISKLDEYKRDALKTCWEQVNRLASLTRLVSFALSG